MFVTRARDVITPAGADGRTDSVDAVTPSALYERYLGDVYRYILQRVASLDDAEDLTAEVFAAAAAALPRYRGQCPLYLWLLAIARRKIIDAGRRRSARRETLASEMGN